MTMSRRRPVALGAMMLLSLGAAACGTPATQTDDAGNDSGAPVATAEVDTESETATATESESDAGAADAATTEAGGTAEPVGDANTRLVGEFEALDGTTVNLAGFHSEDLVLWMWAPW